MVRKLEYHEKKLLKKVDFLQWKSDQSLRETTVMRRYHVQKREDYIKYNRICGHIKKLANRISLLNPRDSMREKMSEKLLSKLNAMGVLRGAASLSSCDKITVSAFCRRRLPVVMMRMKMSESISQAVAYVEQGHVRVGTEVVTDPAYLVTNNMEDYVTWVDTSKIKRKVQKYNDKFDDFDFDM
ncbi:Small subunit (SSU) processome component [Nowakowskiella sp. JEL0078]|nr:Small subunit (SSU) processome component [Nowakowskiella sp. JEL0078]